MSYPSDRKVPGPDVAGLLQGRTALVTGGGAGIGGAISRRFAAAGARVALIDIDADRATETVAEIEGAGGEALALVGDVRDADFLADACRQAEALGQGGVDVLVNNVGHFEPYRLFASSTEEDWEQQYQITYLHVLRATRALLPGMIQRRRGSIVNVTTVEALRGIPANAVYSALNAGLINLTRSLAVEVGRYQVRVNSLAPDLTHTPQTPMYDWHPDPDRVGSWVPLGRFAHPDEQADAALFLASDLARFVTGQNLCVDGGTTAASGWYRADPAVDNWTNTPYCLQPDSDILPE